MGAITRIPRALHSFLRSGAILFDLARVVEELIFNSLDAGATKVYISIGVKACYVKVDDDGCGIARDSLVLLGERYATSKIHCLDDINACTGTLGFKGEALSSLSDVSLLEIITKARGRPNGYRKVIKGCKCIFLGIDGQRQDFGTTGYFLNPRFHYQEGFEFSDNIRSGVTKVIERLAPNVTFAIEATREIAQFRGKIGRFGDLTAQTAVGIMNPVIVHDLFYNQPVRRKYLQSSPKKVLHSVKKCLFRTALVWPHISFKITDIESEDELLSTLPSLSPLPLVTDGFGSEVSSCLHEVNFSKGELKLVGYLSSPADFFCTKVFQYVYINSRFVCKSPIHKLMNNLAASFQCCFAMGKDEFESQNGKRHINKEPYQLKLYPAYMLNLCCTRSSYDLTFEPSMTLVEFKDWSFVLSFFEEAVRYSWSHFPARLTQGKFHDRKDAVSGEGEIWKSDDAILLPLKEISGSSEIPRKKCKIEHRQNSAFLSSPIGNFRSTTIAARNATVGKYNRILGVKNNIDFWERDHLFPLEADNFLPEASMARQDEDSENEDILQLEWESDSVNFESVLKNKEPIRKMEEVEQLDFKIDEKKVSLLSKFPRSVEVPISMICLSPGSVPADSISVSDHEGFDSKTDNAYVDFSEGHDFCVKSPRHEKFIGHQTSPCIIRKCQIFTDLGELSSDLVKHHPCDQVDFTTECAYQDLPVVECVEKGALYESINPKRCILSPYPVSGSGTCRQGFSSFKHNCPGYPSDIEGKDEYLCSGTMQDQCFQNRTGPRPGKAAGSGPMFSELEWLYFDSYAADNEYNVLPLNVSSPNYGKIEECSKDKLDYENSRVHPHSMVRGRRSFSAPPLYRGKRKFFILNDYLAPRTRREPDGQSFHIPFASPVDYSLEKNPLSIQPFHNTDIVQGTSLTKCRNDDLLQYLEPISSVQTDGENSHHALDQESCILDISSGLLHLSGSSLVPESINKDCLDGAKVLLQLDRKFIPIIAGGTFAIIDQHAADERIRLEELRRKVLSGEGKKVTYLDSKKELVLRESGFQLLQNYAEQIKNWGWLIEVHGSGSFTKNLNLLHKRAVYVTLLAVPSILGIDLTDKDLIEFIEQLAETDGSSTMPPAVIRVLNFKACRGAIMFGDSLLPSECSLIVEELRGTSLCFQCAHGRPTTVPIVNLEALHQQLAMLESQNSRSDGRWHGLRQHRPSLERAELRLRSARGH